MTLIVANNLFMKMLMLLSPTSTGFHSRLERGLGFEQKNNHCEPKNVPCRSLRYSVVNVNCCVFDYQLHLFSFPHSKQQFQLYSICSFTSDKSRGFAYAAFIVGDKCFKRISCIFSYESPLKIKNIQRLPNNQTSQMNLQHFYGVISS